MRPGRRFYFRLAALLGCTVQELTHRLTVPELIEWMAYDRLEPFGEGRMILQNAMAIRQQAGRDAQIELTDLVPYFRPPPLEPISEPNEEEQELLKTYLRHKAGIA